MVYFSLKKRGVVVFVRMLIFFSLLVCTSILWGATYTWTGATDTNWNVSTNWTSSDGGISFPGNDLSDIAIIPDILTTSGRSPLLTAGISLTSITVEDGGIFDIQQGIACSVTNLSVVGSGKIQTHATSIIQFNGSTSSWSCDNPSQSVLGLLKIPSIASLIANSNIYIKGGIQNAGTFNATGRVITVVPDAAATTANTAVLIGTSDASKTKIGTLVCANQSSKTLHIEGQVSVDSIELSGVSASNRLTVNGSSGSSFVMTTDATGGRFLAIDTVAISGRSYAVESSIVTSANRPTGWVFPSLQWIGGKGTGTQKSDWAYAPNWDSGIVPGSTDTAKIPDVSAASGFFPILSRNVDVFGVVISARTDEPDSSNPIRVSLTLGSNNITIHGSSVGSWSNNGVIKSSGGKIICGTHTALAENGTWIYDTGEINGMPNSTYNRLIANNGGTPNITISNPITCNTLIVESNTVLSTSANISINNTISNKGTIKRVAPNLNITKNDTTSGIIEYTQGGTIQIYHTLPSTDPSYYSLNVSGGTANFDTSLILTNHLSISGSGSITASSALFVSILTRSIDISTSKAIGFSSDSTFVSLSSKTNENIELGNVTKRNGVLTLTNAELAKIKIISPSTPFSIQPGSEDASLTINGLTTAATANIPILGLQTRNGSFRINGTNNISSVCEFSKTLGKIDLSSGGGIASDKEIKISSFNAVGSYSFNAPKISFSDTTASELNGALSIVADEVAFEHQINCGVNPVLITTKTLTRPIRLAGTDASSLSLTSDILGKIKTTGSLEIGNSSHSGGIILVGTIDRSSSGIDSNLFLTTVGSVTDGTPAGTGKISLANTKQFVVNAGTGISLTNTTGNIASIVSLVSTAGGVSFTGSGTSTLAAKTGNNLGDSITIKSLSGDLSIDEVAFTKTGASEVKTTGITSGGAVSIEGKGRTAVNKAISSTRGNILITQNGATPSDSNALTISNNIVASLVSITGNGNAGNLAVSQVSGVINANGGLVVRGSGDVKLMGQNSISKLAAALTGSLFVNTSVSCDISSLGATPTDGVVLSDGGGGTPVSRFVLSSLTGSTVTQSQKISASSLLLQGPGTFTLSNTANSVSILAASSSGGVDGAVAFTNSKALSVNSVLNSDGTSVSGITRNGAVTLSNSTPTDPTNTLLIAQNIKASGGFTQTSSNYVTVAADISTDTISSINGNISFASPVVIDGTGPTGVTRTISSGNDGNTNSGGSISFFGTLTKNGNLTIVSKSQGTGGQVTFEGNISGNADITVDSSGATGGSVEFKESIIGSGNVLITSSGNTPGTGGNIKFVKAVSDFTSLGGISEYGTIRFSDVLTGSGNISLYVENSVTLPAITFEKSIGNGTSFIGELSSIGNCQVSFNAPVYAQSIAITGSTRTAGDSVTTLRDQTYTGAVTLVSTSGTTFKAHSNADGNLGVGLGTYSNVTFGISSSITSNKIINFEANVVNSGIINVPALTDNTTAINFKGTYLGRGKIIGSTSTNPVVDFSGNNIVFGTATNVVTSDIIVDNSDIFRFSGNELQSFSPNSQSLSSVEFQNTVGTVLSDSSILTIKKATGQGSLTIGATGKLTAGNSSKIILNSSHWINSGNSNSFVPKTSEVSFTYSGTNTPMRVSGDNTFYDFVCTKENSQILFEASKTQTISHNIAISGKESQLITLNSSTTGTEWNINWTGYSSGTQSVDYASIQDSNNITTNTTPASVVLIANISVDVGNNSKWDFIGLTYTWTGTTNTNWNESTNWNPASIPGENVYVRIPALTGTTPKYPVLEADISVGTSGTISISKGAVFTLENHKVIANSITNNGRLRLLGSENLTQVVNKTNDSESPRVSVVEYYGTTSLSNASLKWGSEYSNIEFVSGTNGTISSTLNIHGTTLIANGTGNTLTLSGSNNFVGLVYIGTKTPTSANSVASGGVITINSDGSLTSSSSDVAGIAANSQCDNLTVNSQVAINGNITTAGSQLYNNNVILRGNSILDAGNTADTAITFKGILNSQEISTNYALTIANDTPVNFEGAVGSTAETRLASLTTGTGNVKVLESISTINNQTYKGVVSISSEKALNSYSGSISFEKPLSLVSGTGYFSIAAKTGITQSANAIITSDKLVLGGDAPITLSEQNSVNTIVIRSNIDNTTAGAGTGAGAVAFKNNKSLTVGSINIGGAVVSGITRSGSVTLNVLGAANVLTISNNIAAAGGFSQTGDASVKLVANISTVSGTGQHGNIRFASPIVIEGTDITRTISAGDIGGTRYATGTITFDRAVSGSGNLVLISTSTATPAITFSNTIGVFDVSRNSTTPIGTFVSTGSGSLLFSDSVYARSISVASDVFVGRSKAIPISILTSEVQQYSGNISLETTSPSGTTFTADSNINTPSTANAKTITFAKNISSTTPGNGTNPVITINANIISNGEIKTTGVNGAIIVNGTSRLTGGSVKTTGTQTYNADVSIVRSASGGTTFTADSNINTPSTANAKTITFAKNISSTISGGGNSSSVTINGNIVASGNITTTGTNGLVRVNGTCEFRRSSSDTSIKTSGTQTYNGAVTLLNNITFQTNNTTASDNHIVFESSIGSNATSAITNPSLTINTGSGNLTFKDSIGSVAIPLGNFSITKAADIKFQEGASSTKNVNVGNLTITSSNNVYVYGHTQLTSTTVEIRQENLLRLFEGCSITATGGFSQKVATGKNQIAGTISTTNKAVSFEGETYIDGTFTVNTISGVSSPTSVFRIGATSNKKDLFIASVVNGTSSKAVKLNTNVDISGNLALFNGNIELSGNVSVGKDLILLNGNTSSMYNDGTQAGGKSGVVDLFKYHLTDRPAAVSLSSYPTTVPSGDTINHTDSYRSSITGLGGKTISVAQNFYNNGVNLTATSNWTLRLKDNSNATSSFAESYNCQISYCTVSSELPGGTAFLAASEGCTNLGNNTALSATTGIAFSRPLLLSTGIYTVFDDVIRVEFYDSVAGETVPIKIENSNNEINRYISTIKFNNGATSFVGAFTDRDCTISTNGKGDLSSFYIRTSSVEANASSNRWNTDATGISVGHADSTDRGRKASVLVPTDVYATHRSVIPNIEISKALNAVYGGLRDEHKNRIAHYKGSHPTTVSTAVGATFTDVSDKCDPVLATVFTGQELHETDVTKQHHYDSHNFIELRYSEPVDIGSLLGTPATPSDVLNKKAQSNFNNATSYGGAILNRGASVSSGISITGYGVSSSGYINASSRTRTNVLTENDTTIHALYRSFSIESNQTAAPQSCRIRISIVGYVDDIGGKISVNGTDYNFWPGFLMSGASPNSTHNISGTFTPVENEFIKDRSVSGANSLDAGITVPTANHQLPILLVKKSVGDSPTSSELYGDWDISPPEVAKYKKEADWSHNTSDYELLAIDKGVTGHVTGFEMHFFDNIQVYQDSDIWKWRTRLGWYNNSVSLHEEPLDQRGGSRVGGQTAIPNRTKGGIRLSSIYNSYNGFYFRNLTQRIGEERFRDAFYQKTTVASFFGGSGILDFDTAYVGFSISGGGASHLIADDFSLRYSGVSEKNGFITDLAGNRLLDFNDYRTPDKNPPKFSLTLAAVNKNEAYIVFSKQIDYLDDIGFQDAGKLRRMVKSLRLEVVPGGDNLINYAMGSRARVVSDTSHSTGIIVTFTRDITYEELKSLHFGVNTFDSTAAPDADGDKSKPDPVTGVDGNYSMLYDLRDNPIPGTDFHVISDFAINAISPDYAYDGRNEDGTAQIFDLYGDDSWAIRDFSGSGTNLNRVLGNHDITIVSRVTESDGKYTKDYFQMFVDINPLAKSIGSIFTINTGIQTRLWIGDELPAFSETANTSSSLKILPIMQTDIVSDKVRKNLIPNNSNSSDSFNWKGPATIQFVYKIWEDKNANGVFDSGEDLIIDTNKDGTVDSPFYAVNLKNHSDITSLDLWSLDLTEMQKQRGGTTILNNVINVLKKEEVVIEIDMPKTASLTVQILTLDGNVIKVLQRGRASEGLHYYKWDGTNNAGDAVARGLYFVRVVGPDIDETRKVMAIKE